MWTLVSCVSAWKAAQVSGGTSRSEKTACTMPLPSRSTAKPTRPWERVVSIQPRRVTSCPTWSARRRTSVVTAIPFSRLRTGRLTGVCRAREAREGAEECQFPRARGHAARHHGVRPADAASAADRTTWRLADGAGERAARRVRDRDGAGGARGGVAGQRGAGPVHARAGRGAGADREHGEPHGGHAEHGDGRALLGAAAGRAGDRRRDPWRPAHRRGDRGPGRQGLRARAGPWPHGV